MKAVILAAGMGKRLRPVTEKLPKALIRINDRTLLEYSLDILNSFDIEEVIIVVGYYSELIQEKIGDNYKSSRITYVKNEKYDKTGSMYSLSRAENLIKEDILLLESDLLYEPRAVKTLLDSKFEDVILVSECLNSGDDVYICADEKNEVIHLGKRVPENYKNKIKGALVGISKYSKGFLNKLFNKAQEDYKNDQCNYHYEESVLAIGRSNSPVRAEFCKGLNWIEIDNENDLIRAKQEIYPKINML
jgi:2-aminoethylphosphonate-pyruvate transaminase